jgi:uncharacterized protein YgbK (DUF1537 family)
MVPERWLILADDLTGAADSAIAFARRGLAASVAWSAEAPDDVVLALDAASRRLAPAQAAARHRTLLETHHTEGVGLFKKIDSTLRGQPAAELAATIRLLRERGRGALSVVAPAFPATGRTTEAGRVRLNGQALEDTPLWARDHSYPNADLAAVLAAASLQVRLAALHDVRAGPETLARLVRDAIAAGLDAVVCDASTQDDLDTVAQATLPLAGQVFWTGSAGLAQALAQALAHALPGTAADGFPGAEPVFGAGGILFVVGSVAEASRAASALLAVNGSLLTEAITPAALQGGPDAADWQASSRRIARVLAAGGDVLVEIAADPGADLSQGAELAGLLAGLLQSTASSIGALFATGGETAVALLDALGVTGIRLLEEIEPGVPLGLTRGALTIPVVTKAGAFGDAGTLSRCLSHLRRLRRTEFPA